MSQDQSEFSIEAPKLQKAREGRPIHYIFEPFRNFSRTEASSGILLMIAAIVALIWANSPWKDFYIRILSIPISIGFGEHTLTEPLEWWINDGLMAVFFLMVGLEIKREILTGELSSIRKSTLPIAAAIGGMMVPAILYVVVNAGGPGESGWGIPMATDIAFSLGILSLVSRHVSPKLSLFLAALAIVDDIGAVLVIALFYTESIDTWALILAGLLFCMLLLANLLGARSYSIYIIIGLLLWYIIHESGIHATITGILMAIAIPHRRIIDSHDFKEDIGYLLKQFIQTGTVGRRIEPSPAQMAAVQAMEKECKAVDSPLYRLEHALLPVVSYFIIPVFALANAGVYISPEILQSYMNPIFIGICLGLVVGKQAGITFFAWLAYKLKLADLPEGVTWKQIYGVSLLGGIGFTMSIFISVLAFPGMPGKIEVAKIAIILSSLVAGVAGFLVLKSNPPYKVEGATMDKEDAEDTEVVEKLN